jgi:Fic family protein
LELAVYVAPAPDPDEVIWKIPPQDRAQALQRIYEASRNLPSEYVHWDKLRHLEPPGGLSHEEWWTAIKLARRPLSKPLPLTDQSGRPFSYSMPDEVLRLLHFVDQRCSGEIAMPEVVTADEQAKRHYLVNSLMEEAIRSSQLEGATTSRRVAKELIRSGRPPKDRSERMIVNNYRALLFTRDHIDEPLTPGLVLELQRIITEGTLDNPDAAGRLQRPDEDRVAVFDRVDGGIVHRPPPADELPERLDRLCAFANDGVSGDVFLHPVVQAILLHFWIGYDHPFEDGNGRTARALFYWLMKKNGYWLVEYLSISRILREAPAQYSRAFVYSETDAGDTTYFLIYQLGVVKRAVEELHAYLQRKIQEVRRVERLIKGSDAFNRRQVAVLGDSLRDPERTFTFQAHSTEHGVTHETARSDLLDLQRKRLLERRREGKRFVFHPVPDLADRLRQAPGRPTHP